jgi:hypothetical protein
LIDVEEVSENKSRRGRFALEMVRQSRALALC